MVDLQPTSNTLSNNRITTLLLKLPLRHRALVAVVRLLRRMSRTMDAALKTFVANLLATRKNEKILSLFAKVSGLRTKSCRLEGHLVNNNISRRTHLSIWWIVVVVMAHTNLALQQKMLALEETFSPWTIQRIQFRHSKLMWQVEVQPLDSQNRAIIVEIFSKIPAFDQPIVEISEITVKAIVKALKRNLICLRKCYLQHYFLLSQSKNISILI